MSLQSIYKGMPEYIQQSIAGNLACEHIRILFHDAKIEIENEIKHIDTQLSANDFKLKYLEKLEAIRAYDDILYLIDNIKQENTK